MGMRDLIIKPNSIYPRGIIREEIMRYYESVAELIVQVCAGRYVAVRKILANGEKIFQRHPMGHNDKFIILKNEDDVIGLVEQGAVEFIPEVCLIDEQDRTSGLLIDFDPRGGMTFLECREYADKLALYLAGMDVEFKVLYTGNNGFHFWIETDMDMTCAEARKTAKECLACAFSLSDFGDRKLRFTTKSGEKEKFGLLLDTSPMKPRGCSRALHSLHHKTGLRCVECDVMNLLNVVPHDGRIAIKV